MTDFREKQKERFCKIRTHQLNAYQREAVLDASPACVVNANVGSGKTTVLIEKILYLHFEKKVPLENMVVLTFTNKAAGEIIQRLLEREPSVTEEETARFGTFHSVALFLLKNCLPLEREGWTGDFSVMDPDEETELALGLAAQRGLKIKYKNRLKKRLEQERTSWQQGKTSRYGDDLFQLFPLLEQEKKRQNKMTFSDLIQVSTALLRREDNCPEWIIVDEVQDSDVLQLDFLEALGTDKDGERRSRLFAVGDPNQVIYSWRGTTENMFFLLKHRFQAKELSLPVNYRSNASILEAANRFLQFGGKIEGARRTQERIAVRNHYDPFQEAEYLADRIEKLHADGLDYREIAVFYRLQRQAEVLEKVFQRAGIPCSLSLKRTLGDVPVLDYLVKILKFSVNPADSQTGIQVLADRRYGRKISLKKAAAIVEGREKEVSPLLDRMTGFAGAVEELQGQVCPQWLFDYFDLREQLHPTSADCERDAEEVMRLLEHICRFCQGRDGTFMENLRCFLDSSMLYGLEFLKGDEKEGDGVRLMTLHASKGLEFDTVFLIGMNQGLIPLRCQNFEQEEEERRLFFVGITRARDHLELSYYTNPGEPGVLEGYSPYLRMIPEHLLDWRELRSQEEKRASLQELRREVAAGMRRRQQEQKPCKEEHCPEKSYGEETDPEVRKIRRARHRKYGEGVIVGGDEMMIEVEFVSYGRKQFLRALGEVEEID